MNKYIFKKISSLILICLLVLTLFAPTALAASGSAAVYYQSNPGAGNTSNIRLYLEDAGYTATRYANRSGENIRNDIGSKKVVHIWGHASPGYIWGGNNQFITGPISDNPNGYSLEARYSSLPNCKFIYFEGCNTGVYSSTYGDLDNYAYYTEGVDCTAAYTATIYYSGSNGCPYFSMQVYSHACLESMTVSNAVLAARADMYSLYGEDWGTNSIVVRGGSIFLI